MFDSEDLRRDSATVIYEKHHVSRPDQAQGHSVPTHRSVRFVVAFPGTTHAQGRRTARHRGLVFLPVLLLRVLCHRALRGQQLPFFRALVVWPIPCSTTKTRIATGTNWIE